MNPVKNLRISNGLKKGGLIILSVILLDQLTKYWAKSETVFPVRVIHSPGFFNWYVTAGLLLGFIILYTRYLRGPQTDLGFFLIVGGAISNIFDQLARGSAIDFINLGISTVNLADLVIMMGIGYLILCCKKSIPRQLSD